jgi:predicted MFS family arabinose efflux permease
MSHSAPAPPSRSALFAMAAASGIGVANIYYNQPMMAVILRDFPGAAAQAIPTATQIGYAAGLFLLLPLGDLMERRRLIGGQFLLLALALTATALTASAAGLVAASFFVGMTATVAQQIVPYAAIMAKPDRRGAAIGTVMSGLLCGILLSRTLAGLVAAHLGWRSMFWIGVPLAVIGGGLMAAMLPKSRADAGIGYGMALVSLVRLWREEKALRLSTLTQGLLFASFSALWTILALRLEEPIFRFGADVAGLFGIVGVCGVLAAPLAGRIADRRGPHAVILAGAAVALLSWAAFGWNALAGLIAGVVLLDFGMQGAMISNQHVIYALRPQAQSRLNTIYMTGIFIGGAIGSAGAMTAYARGGWSAVCLFGAALAATALTLQIVRQLAVRRLD